MHVEADLDLNMSTSYDCVIGKREYTAKDFMLSFDHYSSEDDVRRSHIQILFWFSIYTPSNVDGLVARCHRMFSVRRSVDMNTRHWHSLWINLFECAFYMNSLCLCQESCMWINSMEKSSIVWIYWNHQLNKLLWTGIRPPIRNGKFCENWRIEIGFVLFFTNIHRGVQNYHC